MTILTPQSHAAILQEVNRLKDELMGFKNWEAESERYAAHQFEPGVTVYLEKNAVQTGQSATHYCPNCYAESRVKIAHPTSPASRSPCGGA